MILSLLLILHPNDHRYPLLASSFLMIMIDICKRDRRGHICIGRFSVVLLSWVK